MHGSSLETLYKHVDKQYLPAEYLPDDYTGPNAGSTQQIIGNILYTYMTQHIIGNNIMYTYIVISQTLVINNTINPSI